LCASVRWETLERSRSRSFSSPSTSWSRHEGKKSL
jgi:hypothetical protein